MKLKEFQADKRLVKAAMEVASSPAFQEIIKVCYSEHPINNGKIAITGSPYENEPTYRIGLIDGANFILSMIKWTYTPMPKGKEPEIQYAPEE